MKIVVFGAGGVGGYFGGRLAEAGEEVVFIARGAHLSAIREKGLRVESIEGDFFLPSPRATDSPEDVGTADVVLLGVKAWQVPDAARQMRPLVGEKTYIVPLQNGVDAPSQLAEIFGAERVLGGFCQISARIAAPGKIQHTGIAPYLAFGELDGTRSSRAESLLNAFRACKGMRAEIPEDILAAMWRKFLFISAISGIGAVTRQPVGVFRRVPETRAMLRAALEEGAAVASAKGVALPEDIVSQILTFIDSIPPHVTASMQRDLMEGRPSELDSQNGALARMGRETRVPTPTHEFLYAALLPMERAARGTLDLEEIA